MLLAVVTPILLGIIIGVAFLLININKKHNREAINNVLDQFSRLGSKYYLSFSAQELLPHAIIGIDGMSRKLLIMAIEDGKATQHSVIDLNHITRCIVRKKYGSVHSEDPVIDSIGAHLQTITLHIEFERQRDEVGIVFYNVLHNNPEEIRELHEKASHWKMMITKMLMPARQRA